MSREHVRQTAASKRIHLTREQVDASAENELDTREWYWDVARMRKAALESVDLKSLDLTRL